ncbi:MAG: hypothetical protein CK532_06555 [Flavobacteriales bacterium]|nr:MAG: hypothetical protein CK532_06555 [Flavobacteriales bacterium]
MILPEFPAYSRVWIFGSQRILSRAEQLTLSHQMEEFVGGWQAHGNTLTAGFELLYGCLLLLAVDEKQELPSGCSIDKIFNVLRLQNELFGVDFFQRKLVWVCKDNVVQVLTEIQATEHYQNKKLLPDNLVINTAILNLGEARINLLHKFSHNWLGKKLAFKK